MTCPRPPGEADDKDRTPSVTPVAGGVSCIRLGCELHTSADQNLGVLLWTWMGVLHDPGLALHSLVAMGDMAVGKPPPRQSSIAQRQSAALLRRWFLVRIQVGELSVPMVGDGLVCADRRHAPRLGPGDLGGVSC